MSDTHKEGERWAGMQMCQGLCMRGRESGVVGGRAGCEAYFHHIAAIQFAMGLELLGLFATAPLLDAAAPPTAAVSHG